MKLLEDENGEGVAGEEEAEVVCIDRFVDDVEGGGDPEEEETERGQGEIGCWTPGDGVDGDGVTTVDGKAKLLEKNEQTNIGDDLCGIDFRESRGEEEGEDEDEEDWMVSAQFHDGGKRKKKRFEGDDASIVLCIVLRWRE